MILTSKRAALAVAALIAAASASAAQPDRDWDEWSNNWMLSAHYGVSLAFGDDSYNIFQEFGEASGYCVSISGGKLLSPIFGARVKARFMTLNSRTNLETLSYADRYPDLFPNNGFYGYKCAAGQAELLVNITNLLRSDKTRGFNLYLIAGGGVNYVYGYDDIVKKWRQEAGILPGGYYYVDTADRVMPTATVGGMIELRLGYNVGLNIECLCNFTGDKLEGVQYEESYDAYVTTSLGLTYYF